MLSFSKQHVTYDSTTSLVFHHKVYMVIFSSVNPYVGARYAVHCSCCDSEVKPAMTIESGHAVKAISLVEAVDPPNETKPTTTVTIKEIDNDIEVGDSDEPQTMNMSSNAVENASADHAVGEGKTTTPMNITIKETEVIVGNTGETEIKTPLAVPTENAAGDHTVTVQENCVEQSSQSGDELDMPNAGEVQTTCMVSPNVCKNIRLALDKARFSLQKINCTTTKRFQELSREQNEHIKAIETLAVECLEKHDSGIVEGLYLISQELIKTMEHLKENMLDRQQTSLMDIIATLKQDVETEFSSLEQFDVKENKQENEQIVETSKKNPLMTFLKDASWTLFGFTSLLVANLGYFTPDLFLTLLEL